MSKILVIDDEQNIRESTVKLLQRKGYDAREASSGADALRMIQEEAFDLLLMDVRMPGMDGLEVLRRATSLIPDIQVLMLTGHGTLDMAAEAIEYGAIGFLRKPIAPDNLQKSIDDALDRGNTRKENARLRALLPLFELNKQLLTELDEGKLIDIILRTINSEFRADYTEITLWDEDGGHIKKFSLNSVPVNITDSEKLDKEAILRVSSNMQPIVLSRGNGTFLETLDDTRLLTSGFDIFIPLITRNSAIGVVKVTTLAPDRPLRFSDLEFLFTLCSQSSIGISNARLYESLGKAHLEVEELLKRVITNTEDERLRISLELHDGPIQTIFASQFAVQACIALLNDKTSPIYEKLQNISLTLQDSTHSLRRIVNDLHPPDLEKSGLISAIQEYLGIIENEDKLKCHLKVKGKIVKLVYSTERGLYYIVREAITNIKKHAEASIIIILIDFQDNNLAVDIRDDGKGFDLSKEILDSPSVHVGLRGIRERARALHGNITIDSRPGIGTTVMLNMPLNGHVQQIV